MNVTNILRENGQDTLDVTSEESVTDTRPCDTNHEVTCLRAYHETPVITDSAPVDRTQHSVAEHWADLISIRCY